MEYKQFETFQNVSLTELQKKHNLNKILLNSSISELKSSKKEHARNLTKTKVQLVVSNNKLDVKVNKLINQTNKLLSKKKTTEEKKTEKKTENEKSQEDTKVNIVSSKKEINDAIKNTNLKDTSNKKFVQDKSILIKNQNIVKTEPNEFGKIIPIVFTIIAIVCSGLLIYTKQVNVYALLLLSLVISLTIICHCAIGNFCFFDIEKTMWTRTKLGQRCNYTKNMYFTALLCGFLVSYIIFSYNIVIVLIQNIKNYIKKFF